MGLTARSLGRGRQRPGRAVLPFAALSQENGVRHNVDSLPNIKSLDGFIHSQIETPSPTHWLFDLKQITKPI